MIFQLLSPFRTQFSALPIDPGYPAPCFSFPLVKFEPGLSTAIIFSRVFPLLPLIAHMGRQPSGYGHWFPLQKALESRGPVGPSRINPSVKFYRLHHIPPTTAGAMEQVATVDSANFEVHFLNSDDPRHGFTVMSVIPDTYYDFQTPIGFRETHTIVRVDPPPFNLSVAFLYRSSNQRLTSYLFSMICIQLGGRQEGRDRSNVQLDWTTRSGNNDVARSSIPRSPHERARYASPVYARVSIQPN